MDEAIVDQHPTSKVIPALQRWRVVQNNRQCSVHDSRAEAEQRAQERNAKLEKHAEGAASTINPVVDGHWVTMNGRHVFIKGSASDVDEKDLVFSGKKYDSSSGKDTQTVFKDPDSGEYVPDRAALHEAIIQKELEGIPESEHPTIYLIGGGPGAGKTTLLKSGLVDFVPRTRELSNEPKAVSVNPDNVKAQLPEWKGLLKSEPKSAGTLAHEESADVASKLIRTAMQGKRDIVYDVSGDGGYEKLAAKVAAWRSKGYDVVGVYVTVPTEVAWARAMERASKPGPDYGRVLPAKFFADTHAAISALVPRTHSLFSRFELYDQQQRGNPRHVASGGKSGALKIHDPALWQAFTQKATNPWTPPSSERHMEVDVSGQFDVRRAGSILVAINNGMTLEEAKKRGIVRDAYEAEQWHEYADEMASMKEQGLSLAKVPFDYDV